MANGNAGACGEKVTYPMVVSWQNQFDSQILNASQAYGLPPRILKGIFLQESQFWPTPDIYNEYGLGSLTDQGVDALLVTDVASFLKVCVPALGEAECAAGYDSLTDSQRAMLRGIVLRAVGTEEEINLVAQVLLAQVVQVGKIAGDVVKTRPGQVIAYEDLWDLTIASYHAGPGCIQQGLETLKDSEQAITFDQFCQVVSSGCQTACTFTEKVKEYMQ